MAHYPTHHGYSYETADNVQSLNQRGDAPSPSRQYTPYSNPNNHNTPRPHPAAHPDSSFSALQQQRFAASDYPPQQYQQPPSQAAFGHPPPHSHSRGPTPHGPAYSQSLRTTSTVTPGVDNMGTAAAGGGIAGIAVGLAHSNERESGLDAMRGMPHDNHMGNGHPFRDPAERSAHAMGSDNPYVPSAPDDRSFRGQEPYASNLALGTAMDAPGQITPPQASNFTPSEKSVHSGYHPQAGLYPEGPYSNPYQVQRGSWDPHSNPEAIDPNSIVDDGDDGFLPEPKRRSVLSMGRNSSRNSLAGGPAAAGAAAAGAGAAAGGIMGTISNRVQGQTASGPGGGPTYDAVPPERSEWLDQQKTGSKKMKWIVGIIIAVVLICGIVGGVVGGVLGSRNGDGDSDSSSGGTTATAGDDTKQNGDLDKDSAEIKALMNNPDLHKVFPGMDYTPWGTQYPLCHKYPPSQNNVTRDMAVLSQLTNVVRLYGTDCNQTEMVLHAIDQLELKDMKVWLGVWIDTNTTTNDRQIKQLYDILESRKDLSVFKGAIVGNEVLFRGELEPVKTLTDLKGYIKKVKDEFKKLNLDLPVATSDLGAKWTSDLAALTDIVMANVHPFFGGVPVEEAASWTWTFWQGNNVVLTKGTNKEQIISEVGWPTGGGNACNPGPCPDKKSGSVAGVKELNTFLQDWVCPAMKNGTDYFWFSAFDEPWKVEYNEAGKEWEDKWGLMDPGRNLKSGLTIPDCDGKTI
ncbi:hypothetical protein AJ80_09540 [Polytolypa hystricis UAMH7299]|uniref:glucan endo-1,3-beta-D-glucosidase n=1 Tax=Polytolypa hystricis (strain UAMH7299) TaxID=1447883 RepID=A0A2B7WPF2_POLH7|nr:hypothetical protein AJ80_09540 [Polytolypa hystricis UAMH7299]